MYYSNIHTKWLKFEHTAYWAWSTQVAIETTTWSLCMFLSVVLKQGNPYSLRELFMWQLQRVKCLNTVAMIYLTNLIVTLF